MSTRIFSGSEQPGPVENSIRQKLSDLFDPNSLQITNDSPKHRHHTAMRDQPGENKETHFSVKIVSNAFEQKKAMQRHRMIYNALADELDEGLHALSIFAKTPAEMKAIEDTAVPMET